MTESVADKRWRLPATCLACAIAAVIPFAAASAAWDNVSDLRMGVEANDNPRLGQHEVTSSSGSQAQTLADLRDHTAVRALADMRFRLQNIGQRGRAYLEPRIRADAYSDSIDKDMQRKDLFLLGSGDYKWLRAEIGINGNFSHESILSSELLDTGIIDLGSTNVTGQPPIETDTGQLLTLNEHRDRTIVSPFVNFQMSPRSSIGLDARYLDQTYSGAQFRTRSDIRETEYGAHVSRTIDSRTGASARVFASDFHAKATDNDTHTVGVEGTITRKLNEIWSLDLTAGLERSSFNYIDVNGESVGNAAANYILDVGLAKHTATGTVTIDLSRLINPSAAGFMTARNEVRMVYQHAMSQRLTASFAVRAFRTEGLSSRQNEAQRTYTRGGFELDYAFTPTWSLAFGYDVLDQKFTEVMRADGRANILSVSAVYQGLSQKAAGQ